MSSITDQAREPGQISVPILCAQCEQVGAIVIETDAGNRHQVVRVSSGFHLAEGKSPSGDPEIRCDHCDGRAA